MARHTDQDEYPCPHCGALLPSSAHFCRECGSSEEDGWRSDDWDVYHAGDVDEFDYDEYLGREFPEMVSKSRQRRWRQWWISAIILLICLSLALASLL